MPNELGTYSQSFSVTIAGLEIIPECVIPLAQGATARLSTDSGYLEIRLEIPNIDETSAPQLAGRVASMLLDTLLWEFSENVDLVSELKPSGWSFSQNAQPGSPRICIRAGDELRVMGEIVVSPVRADHSKLIAMGQSIALKLQTSEVATSTDLYTARSMFRIGMQSNDKVVRFLILYSAMGLAALFKGRRPSQDAVDDLLRGVNPALQFSPRTSGPRMGDPESIYSKLRNDFVHAEERGKDPHAARTAIEANISVFQHDAAAVLRSL